MTDVYETSEWQHWLQAIRANPDDDPTRLECADWLDERGECERAELIRVAVESHRLDSDHECPNLDRLLMLLDRRDLLVRANCRRWFGDAARLFYLRSPPDEPNMFDGGWMERGFITCVSGPLAALHGGECGRCHGDDGSHGGVDWMMDCPQCNGTGRTPGVLAQLLAREPVGCGGIEVSDRKPHGNADGTFSWWIAEESAAPAPSDLPGDVWDAIEKPLRGLIAAPTSRYPTADAARLALSWALFALHGPKSSPQ